jgi:hypothetical protein
MCHVETQKVFIYTLSDPTTGEVRYVGKTVNPYQRLHGHITPTALLSENHRTHWLRTLSVEGLKPVMTVIEETDEESWDATERRWISHFRSQGCNLVNTSDGGESGSGELHRGIPKPREQREKIGQAHLGRKKTPGGTSSSQYAGVTYHKGSGRWRARVTVEGKRISLGGYETEIEAAQAYDKMMLYAYGPSIALNFPYNGEDYGEKSKAAFLASLTGNKKSASHRARLADSHRGIRSEKSLSSYRGVTWHKGNKAWVAQIYSSGKKRFIGYFDNEEEAARAYDKVAREIFGNGAKLNFPEAFEEKTP